MTTRPLDLLDLPTLYRYRAEAVSLDSTRLLTRGNPLGAAGFLSYFNPSKHLYTGVHQEDGTTLIGGVIQSNGDSFARLVYLAPGPNLNHAGLPVLIEHLSEEAGNWGLFMCWQNLKKTAMLFQPFAERVFRFMPGSASGMSVISVMRGRAIAGRLRSRLT